VCPVKIDIPSVLVDLRAQVVDAHRTRIPVKGEAFAMRGAAWALADSARLARVERLSGRAGRWLARLAGLPGPGRRWTFARDLPEPARESFRAWWRRTRS
jgi:L-lactate dehydrogenase complex protein LldF